MVTKIIYIRNESIVDSDMDGETVMINLDLGKYFGINSVGSVIWKMLEKPHSVSSICDKLLCEYNVESEQCVEEVSFFVNILFENNLIKNYKV